MANVTRHPSTPRKPPPPTRPGLPTVVVLCVSCKDPVVSAVRGGGGPSLFTCIVLLFFGIIPGLLCLIWRELAKRTARTCSALRIPAGEIIQSKIQVPGCVRVLGAPVEARITEADLEASAGER